MSLPPTFTSLNPSQTASRASSYVPPLATSGVGGPTSVAATATSVTDPNPSTPPLQDDHQWITAYLTIHQMSSPSYRYMYILWLAVVLIFLVFALLHWTGRRGGAIGGMWSKWSLRRRTWRKERSLVEARRQNKPHRQPLSLPSNAQLLSLAVLYIATLLLCFVGPDYIAPSTHVWDLTHNLSSRAVHLNSRARIPTTATTTQPAYTIPKAWWTAGGRTGTIAFALFPLCVLFALKSPPFALFALPFLVQIYNDKLAFLHRWTGRLIWLVTALHVALWGVQLSRDKRGTNNSTSVWSFAFEYDKFLFGWLGFICLTLLVALSVHPVRIEFYETFYALHALLIPLTLVFSALHFPPIGWWCWGTLLLWGAERAWRFVRFVRVNGIFRGTQGRRNLRYAAAVTEKTARWKKPDVFELDVQRQRASSPGHFRDDSVASQHADQRLISPTEMDAQDITDPRKSDAHIRPGHPRPFSIGQETIKSFQTGSSVELMSHAATPGKRTSEYSYTSGPISPMTPGYAPSPSHSITFGPSSRGAYIPPPGYAYATLLPGRTVRLRLIPPHHFTWAPGQHILLNVPSVSKFTSHPFTIASVCDDEAQSDERRGLMILVRARTGFTKDLWTHIETLEESGKIGDTPTSHFSLPKRGVLLRAYIDGPFGSSVRARWTSYSTVLIIAGGSGVSFAVSVLEYACMCMAGRTGKHLGGRPGSWGHDVVSQIGRVRFVWIVREFSHIQWVASIIRRCMDMVPSSALQVDIFVTNIAANHKPALSLEMRRGEGDTLAPPAPHFARPTLSRRNSNASDISADSTLSVNTFTDVSYMRAPQTEAGSGNDVVDIVDMYGELGHEEHVLDLTNFDGEDDTQLPGETQLSHRLRKEGKLRRAQTRRSQGARLAKQELGQRVVETRPTVQPSHSPLTSTHPPAGFLPSPQRDTFQSPTASGGLRSPAIHDPLNPSSPLDSPFSPLSPSTPKPNSFLYAADTPRSLSPAPSHKSGAFTARDSDAQHTQRHGYHSRTQSKFEMEDGEAEDMPAVAERARPGKAKIDRIVADEAGRSRGAMVVACCGPTSLNAMVRKSVAVQINPSRILRGDMRASIALVSEDFEW